MIVFLLGFLAALVAVKSLNLVIGAALTVTVVHHFVFLTSIVGSSARAVGHLVLE